MGSLGRTARHVRLHFRSSGRLFLRVERDHEGRETTRAEAIAGGGPHGPREHDRPANPNVATTDLGTQVVNGVNAQGKSTTRTIPAGAMGNAQPTGFDVRNLVFTGFATGRLIEAQRPDERASNLCAYQYSAHSS